MKKKVQAYIVEKQLFAQDAKLLVAVSGGADSVALLAVLHELGYSCEVAHCNFHLRDAESDRDEMFVRALCTRLNIPCTVKHFDTVAEAARMKVSIEMAARTLRYDWFEELRQACGATSIVVAHHQDDSMETFLLNLIRGTGIGGLRGITPKNGYVTRPFLNVSRVEILSYLEKKGLDYVTDSTNLQDEYLRNKVRLHLIPLMEEINPAARENVLRTALHLDDAYAIYNKGIAEAKQRVLCEEGIDIPLLLAEEASATVLYELLSPKGFNSSQIKEIYRSLTGQSGKQFLSSTHRVVKDRNRLLVVSLDDKKEKPHLQMEERAYSTDFVIPVGKHVACLDADKIAEPLSLRLCQVGDSFVPFGMRGRKKLSDYMTDRKFSLLQKSSQWVLCCGDEICWLVNERIDNRFRITQETKRILIITCL